MVTRCGLLHFLLRGDCDRSYNILTHHPWQGYTALFYSDHRQISRLVLEVLISFKMLGNVESLDMENRDPLDMNSFLKVLFTL